MDTSAKSDTPVQRIIVPSLEEIAATGDVSDEVLQAAEEEAALAQQQYELETRECEALIRQLMDTDIGVEGETLPIKFKKMKDKLVRQSLCNGSWIDTITQHELKLEAGARLVACKARLKEQGDGESETKSALLVSDFAFQGCLLQHKLMLMQTKKEEETLESALAGLKKIKKKVKKDARDRVDDIMRTSEELVTNLHKSDQLQLLMAGHKTLRNMFEDEITRRTTAS